MKNFLKLLLKMFNYEILQTGFFSANESPTSHTSTALDESDTDSFKEMIEQAAESVRNSINFEISTVDFSDLKW